MMNSSRDELLQPLLEVRILAMPTPVAICGARSAQDQMTFTGGFSAPCSRVHTPKTVDMLCLLCFLLRREPESSVR